MTTKKRELQPRVEIGFSVNPEMKMVYDRTCNEEKAQLLDFTCDLGGTSANTAKALSNMGIPSRLYALTGYNNDLNTVNLRYALDHSPDNISTVEFNILEKSHLGFTPVDGVKKTSQVFGFKGQLQTNKIQNCVQAIKKNSKKNVWKVATGVRPQEVELVKALFGESYGFRYLNPRINLIKEKKIFFDLLKQTDILVMNQAEFDACSNYEEVNSMDDLHEKFGISLIIVTKSEEGGKFSLKNNSKIQGKYDACFDYIKDGVEIYQTGTGDWFGGSFLSIIDKTEKSIYDVNEDDILKAINFARRVAGKKVTMAGPNNGPKECDL